MPAWQLLARTAEEFKEKGLIAQMVRASRNGRNKGHGGRETLSVPRAGCEGFGQVSTGCSKNVLVERSSNRFLDPVTLSVQSRTNLKPPIDFPTSQTESDSSDRKGQAVFRLSTREEALAVATCFHI
jgi:hypothetical protein